MTPKMILQKSPPLVSNHYLCFFSKNYFFFCVFFEKYVCIYLVFKELLVLLEFSNKKKEEAIVFISRIGIIILKKEILFFSHNELCVRS